MNVLHVIASMNPRTGGVCQAVRTIVGSLEELNVHNEVVCLDKATDHFIKNDNFVLHALGPAKTPWAYSTKLKEWLFGNSDRFDSIIIHGLWLYPSYITAKCVGQLKRHKKESNTKFFVMPHGMLDPYFQKASNRKLKALRNKFYWRLIESKVINNADGLLFTCEEEKNLAKKPFKPYNPKAEIVVGLGVEKPPAFKMEMQDAFFKKCPGIGASSYLLFISRIHEKKGVDLLVRAYIEKYADWKKTGQKQIPKLVIAGPGSDSIFGRLILKLAHSDAEMYNYILFPGMLEGDEKWGAFYCSSAFILPSHQENFGIAVVEALACGKPVFISDKINIWREIKESGAGIVENDSEYGTRELLSKYMDLFNTKEIEKMQNKIVLCYEKDFAIGSSANKLFLALQ